jgi:hypothetical protein
MRRTGAAARAGPVRVAQHRHPGRHEDGAHDGCVEQDRRRQAKHELMDAHDERRRSRHRTDASVTSGSHKLSQRPRRGSHGSASAHARSRERCSSRCCCYQRSCGSSQASVQAPEAPRQPPVRTSAHTGSANAARGRRLEPSAPVVTVPNPVTVKQRTILAALRDAQHANDSQPVGTFAVARWCPEPWTCRVQVVAAALLALQAHGQAVCVSELGGRTWRLTEAGRRQLVPRRGPAPARDRRTTAR